MEFSQTNRTRSCTVLHLMGTNDDISFYWKLNLLKEFKKNSSSCLLTFRFRENPWGTNETQFGTILYITGTNDADLRIWEILFGNLITIWHIDISEDMNNWKKPLVVHWGTNEEAYQFLKQSLNDICQSVSIMISRNFEFKTKSQEKL